MSITKSPAIKVTPEWQSKQRRRYGGECDLILLHKSNDVMKFRKKGKTVVKPLGKAPVHKDWPTRAVNRGKVCKAALEQGRNVGFRPRPGQLVIDVDPRNDGEASFAALCHDAEFDEGKFPRVDTGGGGFHCHASIPEDVQIYNDLKDYPGVEFKTVGRQVVGAGSIHPNGKPYIWNDDFPPIEDGFPSIPKTLLNRIRKPDYELTGEGDNLPGQYTPDQLKAALAVLDPTTLVKSEQAWFDMTCSVSHAVAGSLEGAKLWVDFCTSDPDYADAADDVMALWQRVEPNKSGGITVARFNHALREAGHGALVPACVVDVDEFPDDQGDDMDVDTPDAPALSPEYAEFDEAADDDGVAPEEWKPNKKVPYRAAKEFMARKHPTLVRL